MHRLRRGPKNPGILAPLQLQKRGQLMTPLRRACLSLVALVVAAGCGDDDVGTQPTEPGLGAATAFADSALERVIRNSLSRPTGDLSQRELSSLTELEAQGLGIEELAGLEQLKGLQTLDLADNAIGDISPLASMTELQWLDLASNDIQDISALASLVELVLLDLDGNRIRDLAPLSQLPRLESLFLSGNQITDVSPLRDIVSLESVELSGNPVSQGALAGLTERGLQVTFSPEEATEAGEGNPEDPLGLSRMPGRIAFRSHRNDRWDVYLMDPDGSNETNLTDDEALNSGPCISPDGTRIAFTSKAEGDYDIFVMDVGTGEKVRLPNYGVPHACSWSPDGTRLAFWDVASGESSPSIYVMEADGSGMTRLTREDKRDDRHPTWSPDGRIAFQARVGWGATSNLDILVIGLDGSDETNVTNSSDNEENPSWSPDGSRIAFDRGDRICILDLSSGSVLPLTEGRDPTWSPDGGLLAFTKPFADPPGIWVVEVASGMEVPVGKPGHRVDICPSWSAR